MPATLDQDTEAFLRERGISQINEATYRDFRNHLAVNPALRPSYRGMSAGQIPEPDYSSVQELAEQSLSRSDGNTGDTNGRFGGPPRPATPYTPGPGETSFAGAGSAPSTWNPIGNTSQSMAAPDRLTPTLTASPVSGDITDATGAVVSPGSGLRPGTPTDSVDTLENAELLDELMSAGPTADDVIRGDATSQMPLTSAGRVASMQDAIDQALNPQAPPSLDPNTAALPTAPTQSTLPASATDRSYLERGTWPAVIDALNPNNPNGIAGISLPSDEEVSDYIGETVGNTWEEITDDYGDTPEQVYTNLFEGRFNDRERNEILTRMMRNDPEMYQQLVSYINSRAE